MQQNHIKFKQQKTRSTKMPKICNITLSSPTGPREDLTILATAWHATTANKETKKQKKTHKSSKTLSR